MYHSESVLLKVTDNTSVLDSTVLFQQGILYQVLFCRFLFNFDNTDRFMPLDVLEHCFTPIQAVLLLKNYRSTLWRNINLTGLERYTPFHEAFQSALTKQREQIQRFQISFDIDDQSTFPHRH